MSMVLQYFAITDCRDYCVRMPHSVSSSLSIICAKAKISLTDDDKPASGVDIRQGRSDGEGITYHAVAGMD
jgi:hypothetical protein